jgi:hypothetical protein
VPKEDINLIQRDTEDVCNFDEIDDFSMCIETDDPLVGNPPLKVKVEMEETIDRNNELNDLVLSILSLLHHPLGVCIGLY